MAERPSPRQSSGMSRNVAVLAELATSSPAASVFCFFELSITSNENVKGKGVSDLPSSLVTLA